MRCCCEIDGIWVTEPRCAVAVAIALRESLIALAAARLAGEGQQTKMELVYQYPKNSRRPAWWAARSLARNNPRGPDATVSWA
jgi:hypothetical protein